MRTPCATSAASGACSGLITSCATPVSSRRSMKTRPPWSRRRAAQPASVSALPVVLGAELAARRSRQSHRASASRELARVGPPRPAARAADRRAAPAPTTTIASRAERGARASAGPSRAAGVVDVGARGPRGAAPATSGAPRLRSPLVERRRRRRAARGSAVDALGLRARAGAARSRRRSRCPGVGGPPSCSTSPS